MPCTSNAPKNEGFKEKCNYCHKFEHKKTNCRKLKVVQENKGDVSDPTIYKEAIVSPQSNFWIDEMKDEMTSM